MIDYERKSKYLPKNKGVSNNFTLDLNLLDMMCRYIVSNSLNVRRSQLINMKYMLASVNKESYEGDAAKVNRVEFILKGLEARLKYNLTDPYTILKHISGGILDDSIINLSDYKELTGPEISWLNSLISESLKFKSMENLASEMSDVCNKFLSADYGSKSSIVKEFEEVNKKIQNEFRKSRSEDLEESEFSLEPGRFEDSIYDIHRDLTSPRNLIITGMQGLNELLGGGFEAGRVYTFFGLPGEGKSTILLNLAYQIKKYNKRYKTKDPTKRPCIVLLTMENKIKETVNRLFNAVSNGDSFKHHDPNEIINIMRNEGELSLSDDSPINIFIKYKPSFSVDTSYLYTYTEDLEDRGFEVICMIQDYIGRIKSIDHTQDTRIEYGNVADEFKTYASIKDIPVITASQLNRDASRHIDEGRSKNKADLVRTIGRSNISESMLILNNIDAGYNIAPEYTRDNQKYLGVRKIKTRFETSNREYIYLPFKVNSGIVLEEDYGLAIPTFKTTLLEGMSMGPTSNQPVYYNNKINEIGSGMKIDEEENIFKKLQGSGGSSTVYDSEVAAKKTYILINPLVEDMLIDPLI